MSYLSGAHPGYETPPLSIGLASTLDPASTAGWEKLPAPVLRSGDEDARPFETGTLFKSFIFRDPGATLGAPFVYGTTRDEALDRRMDEIIEVIGDVQREDGYLHTPVIIAQRYQPSRVDEFEDRLHFETYNMGHLMTCACVHYRVTGKRSLLDIAKRAPDFLYQTYKSASRTLAGNAICPSHYMGVVEMSRTTGEPRYLELARGLIDIRDVIDPLIPADAWDWFCLDNVRYHGRTLTILWDRTGGRSHKGAGLRVFADGVEIATSAALTRVSGELP
jgi:hypothetical protein